jgi:hypothetical protein
MDSGHAAHCNWLMVDATLNPTGAPSWAACIADLDLTSDNKDWEKVTVLTIA